MTSPKKSRKKPGQEALVSSQDAALHGFLPEVADWFRASVGTPTEAQAKGWPSIQAGQHTLIVAPTGSGKTLAAFLAGLDALWRQDQRPEGVQILYLSPLKALNQDIERNLERPLAGVTALAESRGIKLPLIRTGVRTGDTPNAQRQQQARKPPDILITTPESLHLILGSQPRRMLKPVRWVIVDELHALAGQKRGTFLAILLERLVQELGQEPVRIGLTATVNPLETAAQFLGGFLPATTGPDLFVPRPVNVVRAAVPKQWDLQVQQAEIEPDPNQPRTIWPSLEKALVGMIGEHNSTLIFANNRYLVERLSARINEQFSAIQPQQNEEDKAELEAGDTGQVPEADDAWVHAHHGSVSLDRRRRTETALKEGRLRGVISTASLEMGIDMGAVDLVCQVGSPGEVARGLQRVGRAGHGVGQVSKGRFFARTSADLLETAALVEAMSRGAVEPLTIPRNCLDLLAQQVVACVATRPWGPRELYQLFRRSYPYQELPEAAFESVLEMLSGRFRVEAIRDLKARIFWDRVRNELIALPGTSSLALMGGGAIPDTGQYAVKLGENGPTLGSLDEEFVLERRPGEAFRLGSSTWRIDRIEADRVVVSPSGGGDMVVMPFWRGEEARRSATLGAAIGGLVRRVAGARDIAQAEAELVEKSRLAPDAARDLVRFIKRQKRVAQAVPDDRTIVVEAFRDQAGEVALVILSPWGGRLHLAMKLILQNLLNERLGFRPAAQHADDGLIMRLPRDVDGQPPLDLLDVLDFKQASDRLRQELADSALFGLRFRQNAARSLLLPRPDPGKRTPLWLQRLRAKDLLQVVRQMPDFPVVLECYRECLSQDLDLELLESVLGQIATGEIKVVKRSGEAASPFAADLMNRFERKFLYEWDEPHKQKGPGVKGETKKRLSEEALNQLLDPRVVEKLGEQTAKAWNRRAKSAEEFAERFTRLGELLPGEVSESQQPWLEELEDRELCVNLVSKDRKRQLWISADELQQYRAAFPNAFRDQPEVPQPDVLDQTRWAAIDMILSRFVKNRPLTALEEIIARYPIEPSIAADWLARWTETGGFVRLKDAGQTGEEPVWADSRQMQRMVEMSLAQRRRDVRAVSPESWSAWVLNQAFSANQLPEGQARQGAIIARLESVLLPLQGWAATLGVWVEEILPARLAGVGAEQLDTLLALGDWSWLVQCEADQPAGAEPRVAFHHKAFPAMNAIQLDANVSQDGLSGEILSVLARQGPATSRGLAERLSKPLHDVRQAIGLLMAKQAITNEKIAFLDRFNRVEGENKGKRKAELPSAQPAGGRRLNSFRALLSQQGVGGGGRGPGRAATVEGLATEGRWRLVQTATGQEDEAARDERMAAWSALLMERYGVVCREVVKFGCPGLDWSELTDWLEAAEWRGEVRRGYFVEALSGVQFTTDDIATGLALYSDRDAGGAAGDADELHLVSVLDPANLYGASAPLDLPLLAGGRARLPRISGNAILMAGGRPVWIIQESGRRLTGLPHASDEVRRNGLRHLIRYFTKSSNKWTITSLDETPPVKSPWADELAELGFVRDGLSMTLYRGLS